MVTVVISAHITLDGALRIPGTVLTIPDETAKNLIRSGYAYIPSGIPTPDGILGSSVVVLNLGDPIPAGLAVGAVVLRRPT